MESEPATQPEVAESIGTPSIISEISTTGATVGDSPDNTMNANLNDLDSSVLNICRKPKEKSTAVSAKFWGDSNWREQLCTCTDCMKVYEEENVAFLVDLQDTVLTYEEKGKVKALEIAKNAEESELKFLSSLDRYILRFFVENLLIIEIHDLGC